MEHVKIKNEALDIVLSKIDRLLDIIFYYDQSLQKNLQEQ